MQTRVLYCFGDLLSIQFVQPQLHSRIDQIYAEFFLYQHNYSLCIYMRVIQRPDNRNGGQYSRVQDFFILNMNFGNQVFTNVKLICHKTIQLKSLQNNRYYDDAKTISDAIHDYINSVSKQFMVIVSQISCLFNAFNLITSCLII